MVDKNNLIDLFKAIDNQLLRQDSKKNYEIIIYGGAALISLGVSDRATVDIDVFDPKIDHNLQIAISEIAHKYNFDERWMNSTGAAFVFEMPEGWRTRIQPLFQGQRLKVKVLGRIDLIYTKFLAELDRGEDLEDLMCLKPTKNELKIVEKKLNELESENSWNEKIDEIIEELLRGNGE